MSSPRSAAARCGPGPGERGIALLSALLSVALLTIIVMELADATLVNAHLSRNAGNALAAQLLARSAEVAGEALLIDAANRDSTVTKREWFWSIPLPGFPAGPGSVGLEIADEEGKLDLNSIGDKRQRAALEKVFASLSLDPRLLDAIDTWTAPAAERAAPGRDSSGLCALSAPCEPRRGPLLSLDELRAIRGFDPATIARLGRFVTAYGVKGTPGVNVNTADPLVLRAIGCDVGADFSPPADGFKNTADVVECQAATTPLKLKSGVFSIRGSGLVGDVARSVEAIVSSSGRRATRLTWCERPASDPAPIEVP